MVSRDVLVKATETARVTAPAGVLASGLALECFHLLNLLLREPLLLERIQLRLDLFLGKFLPQTILMARGPLACLGCKLPVKSHEVWTEV